MSMKDYIKQDLPQLLTTLDQLRREQLKLRVQAANNALHNKHLLTVVKRNIARVNTLITQRRAEV